MERRGAIRRFPDQRSHGVEREQRGIGGRHHHDFITQCARRNLRASSEVAPPVHTINSQTRASGVNVSLFTGTVSANSQALWNTGFTISGSLAKKRIFLRTARIASSVLTSSILFFV